MLRPILSGILRTPLAPIVRGPADLVWEFRTGLPANLTLTRASEQWVRNSSGVLTALSSGAYGVHHDTDLTPLGYLDEEECTNVQTLGIGKWLTNWTQTNITATDADTTGPDGLTSAGTITNQTTSGIHAVYKSLGTTTIGVAYPVTLILKKAATAPSPWMAIVYYSSGFGGDDAARYANVNLDTGEFSATNGTAGRFIEDLGGGWWAVTVEHTAAISGAGRIYIYTLNGDIALNTNWSGSTAAHMHLWSIKAQAKASAGITVPTSPVPTPTGSAVTRAASTMSGSFTARRPSSVRFVARTAKGKATGINQFLCSLVGNSGVPIEIYREPVDGYVIVSHGASTYAQGIKADHTDIDITVPLSGAPIVDTIHVGTDALGANHWNGSIARIEVH